jgi:hypothetical protein
MRSDACGLLELPREMKYRQSRNSSELCEIDALAKVCLYMFAHPTHGARRQTAHLWDRHYLLQTSKQIQARACVQSGSYGVFARPPETLSGGVTGAGQTSSLPPTTSRVGTSVVSVRRKSARSYSNILHRLTPARNFRSSSISKVLVARLAPMTR